MPVAYISTPPSRCSIVPTIEQSLYSKGWATMLPPLRIMSHQDTNADRPEPDLVEACVQALSRSELLVCVDGWEECELCRIEHKYATDNNIAITETEDGRVDVMEGEEFEEKHMAVEVQHRYHHCHRTRTQSEW